MTDAPGPPGSGSRARLLWMIPLALTGLVFLTSRIQPDVPLSSRGINDFMGMYAHARLVGSPDQYNAARYTQEQIAETGWVSPAAQGNRLPIFAWFLKPVASLPYLTAFRVWLVLLFGAFLGFLILWPEGDRGVLLLAACWSYPLFADFANGQDVPFLLLFLAVAMRVYRWRPDATGEWLAGAILALCALKFHLFLLVPILLVAQRQWRMIGGGSLVLAVLYAASSLVSAPHWAREFVRSSLGADVNPNILIMPNLRGLLYGVPHAPAWELASAVCVAAAVAWLAYKSSFSAGLSAALMGGILVGHHAYTSDGMLLLPALVTLGCAIPSLVVRLLAGLLLCPLPFLVVPLVPLAAPVPYLMMVVLVALIAVEWNRRKPGRPFAAGVAPN